MVTKEELINFENWTVDTFNAGKLKSPVHLSGGNEEQVIEIFKDIKSQDWVFTTYRSHYHALLKGVPEQRLKDWILDNKSIHFMDSEYKVFSSAIVGGCLPIALGTAMAIKRLYFPSRKTKDESQKSRLLPAEHYNVESGEEVNTPHVWIFIGDMTASLGVFRDCYNYAKYNKLPITFVIEDNGLSTDTITKEAWGGDHVSFYEALQGDPYLRYYKYKRVYPHYGTGKFIASIWTDIIKADDARNKGF